MQHTGRVLRVGDNIDTDAVIPARYMVLTDPKELGAHCMEGMDPNWIKGVRPGDILVGGSNFGCGSSREHAPIAILGAGIKVVIANTFARIFYRSSFNVGLLLLEIGDAVADIQEGQTLEIHTNAGTIRNKNTGKTYACPPLPPSLQSILDSGGLEPYVKTRLEAQA